MPRFLDRLEEWSIAALMGAAILVIFLSVVHRYACGLPIPVVQDWLLSLNVSWAQELCIIMFIWMVMLGAMVGVREGTHFEVDLWPELKPRPRALLAIVSQLFVLVFAVVFVWWGIEFVRFGWDQTSELADLPMPYIFIAWPVAGLTWIVFLGEQFVDNLRVLTAREAGP